MQLVTGSYTGNEVDDRSISGVGFQPHLVIVKGDGNLPAVFIIEGMPAGESARFEDGAFVTDQIQDLEADGFQVGAGAFVNTNGETYYYVAFRDDGNGDFAVGSYSGNATDDRSITGVGFQPTVLLVTGNTQDAVWTTVSNGADDTMYFDNAVNFANAIQALEADGFQVGTHATVNSSGVTYYYAAWKDVAGYIETGTYSGNAADNRSISGAGFQPDVVIVKGDFADHGVFRVDTMDALDSAQFNAAAPNLNYIQAFEADGFQIGDDTNVNNNGSDYFWAAFLEGTTPSGGIINPVLSLEDRGVIFGGQVVR